MNVKGPRQKWMIEAPNRSRRVYLNLQPRSGGRRQCREKKLGGEEGDNGCKAGLFRGFAPATSIFHFCSQERADGPKIKWASQDGPTILCWAVMGLRWLT